MSDRIDELVALIRPFLYPRSVADNSLTELATIARKAEAERGALLAEHEAGIEMRAFIDHGYGWTRVDIDRYKAAHDNAERVVRGE